jgi:hypothetical protein
MDEVELAAYYTDREEECEQQHAAFMAACYTIAVHHVEETQVNTEELEDAADRHLRSRMTKHIRTAPQAGAQIPCWLANDPEELHDIKLWQEQAIDDMQLRQAADQVGPVWGPGPVARPSTMEQIDERAAVAHSTYIYPREEDCEESAGREQQWMVDQGNMEMDEEGIAQEHPHMAVPARSAMKRQDGEKTGESAGSGRHVAWATQEDIHCGYGQTPKAVTKESATQPDHRHLSTSTKKHHNSRHR